MMRSHLNPPPRVLDSQRIIRAVRDDRLPGDGRDSWARRWWCVVVLAVFAGAALIWQVAGWLAGMAREP